MSNTKILYSLFEKIEKDGNYPAFWLILGSCISADSNTSEEAETKNDERLREISAAIELFGNPPEEFIQGKIQIDKYMRLRESGKISYKKTDNGRA